MASFDLTVVLISLISLVHAFLRVGLIKQGLVKVFKSLLENGFYLALRESTIFVEPRVLLDLFDSYSIVRV